MRFPHLFTAIALAALSSVTSARAAEIVNPVIDTTFNFVGVCTDCTGDGIGTLVVDNYIPGAKLNLSDFVSFTYASNLVSFEIDSSDVVTFGAILGSDANSYKVTLSDADYQFLSFADGSWEVDLPNADGPGGWNRITNSSDGGSNPPPLQNADYGSSSTYTIAAATPEPSSILLLGTGVAGVLGLRRRKS